MKTNLVPYDAMAAVRDKLNGDSTLIGASMLNGSNKVFVGRAPRGATLPYATLNIPALPQTDAGTYIGELRVVVRVSLTNSGQPDVTADRIMAQVVNVLDGEIVGLSGGAVLPLRCLGTVPSLVDQLAPEETMAIARFQIEAGLNG